MNQTLFTLVHQFAGRSLFLDYLGIFTADYLPYLMGVAFLVLAWYQEGWRRKAYLFAEGALAAILSRGIVTELIRFFYHHPRPFDFYHFTPLIAESGSSFPSGHMTFFFALAVVIWYANRTWGWWYLALSAAVGIARIYVGVHWPYDIAGGALIGIACGLIVHWALRKYRKELYRAKPAAPPSTSAVS